MAETQPKLQPAFLRLSAIISQALIGLLPFSLPDEFPIQRNLSASFSGLNDLQAREQYHGARFVVLAIWVFASLHGNNWCRRDVSKRGFTYVGTEQADTPAIYDP
jgi:hypothetical protein